MKNSKYWVLFWSLLKISATTFGGGFVIVPLMKSKFVDELELVDEDEMLDLMAIAQSCPGSIAVNASIMLGYKIAGIRGGMVALLATIIPPLSIISIISAFYNVFRDNRILRVLMSGMLCGVCAIIFDVVWQMIKKLNKKIVPIGIMIAAFIMNTVFKSNILLIIGIGAVVGLISSVVEGRMKK